MHTLALLLVIPIMWPFIAKAMWRHEITMGELAINLAVGIAVTTDGFYAGRWVQTADTEVLNGRVTSKAPERVSCSHSYSCNCVESCSGSGTSRSCSTSCSTCYEHDWDQNWVLRTNLGPIHIDRVDSRGLVEPKRFTAARVDDPVAMTHLYTNWIKAAEHSLFNTDAERQGAKRFAAEVPAYPLAVYDYHYLDRVIARGFELTEAPLWNLQLARMLRTLGPEREVNVVVLLTATADPAYADAVRVGWRGGKKNDVVVVVGVGDARAAVAQAPHSHPVAAPAAHADGGGPTLAASPAPRRIEWVRVLSWTDAELMKVKLRDAISAIGALERDRVLGAIASEVGAGFVRKPMADFEYLKDDISPPGWVLALLVLVSLAASGATSFALSRNRLRTAGAPRFVSWRSGPAPHMRMQQRKALAGESLAQRIAARVGAARGGARRPRP